MDEKVVTIGFTVEPFLLMKQLVLCGLKIKSPLAWVKLLCPRLALDLALLKSSTFHWDNGVFAADVFQADCTEKHQSQSFSGVGAHHQNACVEHTIQTNMYRA